jgi:ubiquinone/menaquinone biosynthesis C-methylase UbiE
MRIHDAYNVWSNTYDLDRNLTRDLDQMVTKLTLANLHFHTILEIGCGTGKNTSLLAQISERVWALDLSVGMLQQAKTKLDPNHVLFAVADVTKPWPCKAESIELIVCNLVLEHIQELSVIFAEAHRALLPGGHFFLSELHPFRQYQGTQANFRREQQTIEIQAFVHHLSDFTDVAARFGLALEGFKEWWHETDKDKPPRLVSFMFQKP